MNAIILNQINSEKQTIELTDIDILNHLNNVIRPKIGESLKVIIVSSGLYLYKVTQIKTNSITLKRDQKLENNENFGELFVAFSRPQTLKKILFISALLGVKSINIFRSALSDKSYEKSKVLQPQNIKKQLNLGLSQGAYYSALPIVKTYKYFPIAQAKDHHYFLNPNSLKKLKDAKTRINQSFWFGPERGFTGQEMDLLKKQGLSGLTLGKSIFRTEDAIVSLLSQFKNIY